jgi:hypothetical protein
MAKSSLSLDRLLTTPHLERLVPLLPSEILHRVIEHYGLDHCAELVALASPTQIARLLDVDAWRASTTNETFDADRFGLWLDVLMQSGPAVAAEKLADVGPGLVIAGLAGHIRVFDQVAVTGYVNLEGDYVEGRGSLASRTSEIGGYFIEATRGSGWDVIVALLVYLQEERPATFDRLMRGCVRLSDGAREADGFHDLLGDDQQQLFDVASERAGRREAAGYLSPADARAFLQGARRLSTDSPPPPDNADVRAYFRAIAPDPAAPDPAVPNQAPPETPSPTASVNAEVADGSLAAMIDLLADAGVIATEPRRLGAGDAEPQRLALLQSHLFENPRGADELAFLANALIAGTRIQDRTLTPKEAADAAAATCNLGLERWPERWARRTLITAFQIGWQILHRDVCIRAAQQLLKTLPSLRGSDRGVQLRLTGLRMRLARTIADGAPWEAREQLDVLLPIDGQAWAGMVTLIGECPVVNAAVRGSAAARAIELEAFEFMSTSREVEDAERFIERLPALLQ